MEQARRDLAMAGQARDTGFFEWARLIAGCREGDKGGLPEAWGGRVGPLRSRSPR